MSNTKSVISTDTLCNCVNILRDPKLVRQFQIYFGVPKDCQYSDSDSHTNVLLSDLAEDNGNNDHCPGGASTEEIRNRSSKSTVNGSTSDGGNVADKGCDSSEGPANQGSEEQIPAVSTESWTLIAKLFYHLFKFGSALGDDVFYFVFFSIWSWHLDLIVIRKLGLVWGIVLYVGQFTKDLVRWPRPHSPPVVILERRFEKEFGMPSTHAMIGLAIPTCMVLLTNSRYEHFFSDVFPLWAQASLWIGWTSLVSLSRIYVGMHSVLDVLVGLCYAALLMMMIFPWVDVIDSMILENAVSPLVLLGVYYSSIYWYPSLETWSSTIGDTSATVSISSGIFISGWMNNYLGLLPDSVVDDYFFREFSLLGIGGQVLKYFVGLAIITPLFIVIKKMLKWSICSWYGCSITDKAAMKRREIEIPYIFFTFFVVSIIVSTVCPVIFQALNI